MLYKIIYVSGCITLSVLLFGCKSSNSSIDSNQPINIDFKTMQLENKAAYIPSMCYTKTEDKNGGVHNPCYACHTPSLAPNYVEDGDIQVMYSFAAYARENHWSNLFIDRKNDIDKITDNEIATYVGKSNYFDSNNEIILVKKLINLPKEWDIFDDGHWYGYIPDCYFNFGDKGFDKNPNSEQYTGWRAFHYTPFLGTFWPTNGSTDDVMIRLADIFRNNTDGVFDLEVYRINLAIVEALIHRKDTFLESVDEKKYAYDLNGDGKFETSTTVVYNLDTLHFVGEAGEYQDEGKVHLVAGLFPVGTEFLHSVRYVDIDNEGNAVLTPHMKELRYGIKKYWVTPSRLEEMAENEIKEKMDYPDHLRQFDGNIHIGLDNKQGWSYQGFIEDTEGELRPQNYEETYFCMGCHSGLGATTDGVFAFPRKVVKKDAFRHGWAYATQIKVPDSEPKRLDGKYEYTYYLKQNHAGDEFRENRELIDKFFTEEGELNDTLLDSLHKNISTLISPSKQRAIEANKAYRVIVKEQSFIYGRDATSDIIKNVHTQTEENQLTGVIDIIKAQ